ncbi:MAG: NADP-dependent oxidoreductase [Lacipirellulaceae bacterium]
MAAVVRVCGAAAGDLTKNAFSQYERVNTTEETDMTTTTSRAIHLVSRPKGIPVAANFTTVQSTLAPPNDREVLVRNLFVSVDPYMRGRMTDTQSYVPPFEIGKPLEGGAVGEVVESRATELQPGEIVVSNFGWRERFVAPPEVLQPVGRGCQPLSVYLGALGMPGMTAWAGLHVGELKAGETFYVSGAAGAVGSVAGQLAKIRGCRVIGSAGSAEKVAFLQEECGFDAAFNYKDGPVLEQLKRYAPDGIDVYFDNVGGESLEAALAVMRLRGRIIACGGISSYNSERPAPGPTNLFNMTTKRLTMKGLIVSDWLDRQAEFREEVSGYFKAGRLIHKETVVEGIDQAVAAFIGLFHGDNLGKMVVKIT